MMKNSMVKIAHEVVWIKDKPSLLHIDHPKIVKVVCQYLDGRVKTESGDVWKVKEVNHPEYKWITVGTV